MKSSEQHHSDQATKTAMGKYTEIHSSRRIVLKFSVLLGFSVSEATAFDMDENVGWLSQQEGSLIR